MSVKTDREWKCFKNKLVIRTVRHEDNVNVQNYFVNVVASESYPPISRVFRFTGHIISLMLYLYIRNDLNIEHLVVFEIQIKD